MARYQRGKIALGWTRPRQPRCELLVGAPGLGKAVWRDGWPERTMATLDDELLDLIAGESLVDRARLTREATLADIGLDSVDMISIVFAVEEKYAVEIPENAFAETTDLGGFLDILERLIEKPPARA
jgi:acyl carrier protein